LLASLGMDESEVLQSIHIIAGETWSAGKSIARRWDGLGREDSVCWANGLQSNLCIGQSAF
jgi:hypothetical protein